MGPQTVRSETGLAKVLRRGAGLWGDRVALVLPGWTATYGELASRAGAVAARLAGAGIEPGSRIALVSGLDPAFFDVLFGAALVGAVPVPINTWLTSDETGAILADCDAALVACSDAEAERLGGAGVSRLWRVGGELPQRASAGGQTEGSRAIDALQLYTSGTTGAPKGVVLSSTNVVVAAMSYAFEKGFVPSDRLLVSAPPFFSGSVVNVLGAFAAGAAVEFMPGFDPQVALARLSGGAVTVVAAVPTMIYRLVEAARAASSSDFGALRLVMYGGGPMTPELLGEAMERLPCRFWQGFGLTEATVSVTALRPDDHRADRPELLASVGRALLHAQLGVVDADGRSCGPGEVGEVVTAGPHVMDRYWRRPEESAAAVHDGWLHTGDLGALDEDGYLFLHGRRNALIVSGGVNIYPQQVEGVLLAHPRVRDCAVVGAPDPQWGEVVVGLVCARDDGADLPAALNSWCKERLPAFRRPKRWVLVDELPRTASGKTSLPRLRALAMSQGPPCLGGPLDGAGQPR